MNPQFLKVLMNTVVVKLPNQALASFGTTVVTYNMVTRPLYQALDVDKRTEEAVLRRGTVKAERPRIVTPQFLSRASGFGDEAQEFMRELIRRGGQMIPGFSTRIQTTLYRWRSSQAGQRKWRSV